LNEKQSGTGSEVFKAWNERLSRDKFVESDDDDAQLIFHIPFSGSVRLKSICIVGENGNSCPRTMKMFINREDLDFSTINDTKSIQDIDEMHQDPRAEVEYPLRVARFTNVSTLTLFFTRNYGAENTKIYYIGLKGDFFGSNERKAVITTYESKPQISDHKNEADVVQRSHLQ